jgi:hypothetical protein
MDREHWPTFMKRRIAEFNLEEVTKYIQQAVLSSRKKYFTEQGWAKFVEIRKDPRQISDIWQSRLDLFCEVESYLGEDPASEKAQALAVRWTAHMDGASCGNPELKAGLRKTWADRRQNWTATVRYLEETLSGVAGERFDQVAAFIDKVMDSSGTRIGVLR